MTGTLEAVQTRLHELEQHHPQMEGQLDVLIRMMQPAVQSPSLAQARPRPRGSDPDMV